MHIWRCVGETAPTNRVTPLLLASHNAVPFPLHIGPPTTPASNTLMIARYLLVLALFACLDAAWLLVVGASFNRAQFGHLMRPDTLWGAAVLFYLIYGAAVVALCIQPARTSGRAWDAAWRGALLGLAAYGAFDLTSLALFKDFPLPGAIVDMIWGTTATAVVSAAASAISRRRGHG